MPTSERKQIQIEFLYADMETCTRCKGTDANLAAAIAMAQTLLEAADTQVSVRKTLVDSEQKAIELGFRSSPTIRVNGRDVAVDLHESRCEDCTGICGCGEDIACRVWRYKGEDYDLAPVPVLLNAIMSAAYSPMASDANPVTPAEDVPANLQRFFAARRNSSGACCGPEKASGCCAPVEKSSCCGNGPSTLQPAACGCQ